MPISFPSILVSQQSQKQTTPDVIRVKFGNGAEQRMANGINYLRDSWTVTWSGLTSGQRDTIVSFLISIAAGDYTNWTSPMDASSKKYVLEGAWSVTTQGGDVFEVTAAFRQVYEP